MGGEPERREARRGESLVLSCRPYTLNDYLTYAVAVGLCPLSLSLSSLVCGSISQLLVCGEGKDRVLFSQLLEGRCSRAFSSASFYFVDCENVLEPLTEERLPRRIGLA